MDFELSQDHKVLRDSVRDFVEKEIKPIAMQIDEEHMIPDALVRKMGEMGFSGATSPRSTTGPASTCSPTPSWSKRSPKRAAPAACSSPPTPPWPAARSTPSAPKSRRKWLPDLNTGEKIGCFLLTEPDAGSDAGAIATTYRRDGDDFVVNGAKIFITNGGYLGTGVLFATSDKGLKHKGVSAFIVDLKSPGSRSSRMKRSSASAAATPPPSPWTTSDPGDNLLGQEGQGFKIAMEP